VAIRNLDAIDGSALAFVGLQTGYLVYLLIILSLLLPELHLAFLLDDA
jgi:hypothetical protein